MTTPKEPTLTKEQIHNMRMECAAIQAQIRYIDRMSDMIKSAMTISIRAKHDYRADLEIARTV